MAYRNIRLNPVLRLLYLFFRTLSWLGIRVLYRRRLVLGRQNFKFDGPAIVIVNHTSTLMDVLNPGLEIRQEMFFLANYGLFRNPVSNWVFRRLFCIPVMRPEDMLAGQVRDNTQAFQHSFEHLEKHGVLFIAPEGTSWIYRYVRPLKTGTARIALGVEAKNNWHLGVKIIPVGMSYSAVNQFRSDVVVQAGEAVQLSDWAPRYLADPVGAVDELTEVLEQRLKNLTIHCRDDAGEQLVSRLETILANSTPLPQQAAFYRSQQLTRQYLDDWDLQEKTDRYWRLLEGAKLSDLGVARVTSGLDRWIWPALILGLPFFLLGYAAWWLPSFLPWWVDKKLKLYIGYSTTVKMLVGLFTFPLALWACWKLAFHFSQHTATAWLCVGAMVLLAYFTERFLDWWAPCSAWLQTRRWKAGHPEAWEALSAQRDLILQRITGPQVEVQRTNFG